MINGRMVALLLAVGCGFVGESAPPGGSAPLPSGDSGTWVGVESDCTEPAPSSLTLPCTMPIDAIVVADCAAGGHAAMWNGIGFGTIADALDAAGAGDLVQVCPGTWSGPVQVDREVLLEAADPTPGATVIDGGGSSRGLEVRNPSTIRGLTVRNGSDLGIQVTTQGVVLECMTVEDNREGGIDAWDGLVLRTSTLRRNKAGYEGGALAGGGTFLVEDSRFEGNISDNGGGAVAIRGDATFTRTTFTDNVAD